MDVFKIEQSLVQVGGGPLGVVSPCSPADKVNCNSLINPADPSTEVVSFDAHAEFNLSFFDTTPPPQPHESPEDTIMHHDHHEQQQQQEDSMMSTHDHDGGGGFSDDPGSVGSTTSASSPPPPPLIQQQQQQKLGPLHLPLAGTSATSPTTTTTVLLSPHGGSNGTLVIKQEQQHYVAADSNSSSTTKSFVPCKVCGDKASGYHYGVTSCEGCKGFFRRSIQKQIEYRCLRDGKCLVIRLNRNRCQFCRFKKCLSVGMSRDSVRYGRVPKRSRERSTDESSRVSTTDSSINGDLHHHSSSSPSPIDTETKQLAIYDMILAVSAAYSTTTGYTEDSTRNLVRKPVIVPPASPADSEVASSTAEALEQERCWLWQEFSEKITHSVQRVVEFAKKLPGFLDLAQDDQLILIKLGFFEVWLSHIAKLTTNSMMMFEDGTTVNRRQLEIMYDVDFISSLLHFANTFNALALNDTEIGIFSAIVLFTADRHGVIDAKTIEHHQDRLIEALKVQVSRNHANEPQVFSSLLMKLPELRNLGAKHLAHLDWFRINWTKLSLPPLFAEIFDIPKAEEDLQ